MNSMSKRRLKGYNAERELVNKFKELKIWATRIPVSGIGQPLPDVLAIANGVLHGFEIKVSSDLSRTYYRKSFDNVIEWIMAMKREYINAEAWLAVKFRGNKWRFYKISDDFIKIKADINSGLNFAQLLNEIRNR